MTDELTRENVLDGLRDRNKGICTWDEDENGNWHTGCGECFVITNDGTPEQHGMKFCTFCGNAIEQRVYREEP